MLSETERKFLINPQATQPDLTSALSSEWLDQVYLDLNQCFAIFTKNNIFITSRTDSSAINIPMEANADYMALSYLEIVDLQERFNTAEHRSIRIRNVNRSELYLTIKISRSDSITQDEIEVAVTESVKAKADVFIMSFVTKHRFTLMENGLKLEVDWFSYPIDDIGSYTLVELEITDETPKEFTLPAWVGKEVTGDPVYFNSTIAKRSIKKLKPFAFVCGEG